MGFSRYSPNKKYPPLSDEQKAELFRPAESESEYEHEPRRPIAHKLEIFGPKTPKPKLL